MIPFSHIYLSWLIGYFVSVESSITSLITIVPLFLSPFRPPSFENYFSTIFCLSLLLLRILLSSLSSCCSLLFFVLALQSSYIIFRCIFFWFIHLSFLYMLYVMHLWMLVLPLFWRILDNRFFKYCLFLFFQLFFFPPGILSRNTFGLSHFYLPCSVFFHIFHSPWPSSTFWLIHQSCLSFSLIVPLFTYMELAI